MPNIRGAHKALRQSERKQVANLRQKRDLLGSIKLFRKSVEGGDIESAKTQLPSIFKKLDKAAKVNVIKKNRASRLKSRLSKKLGGVRKTTKDQ